MRQTVDLGTINAAAITLMAACLLAIRLLDAALDALAARAETKQARGDSEGSPT